jgi:hypothetical protein
VAEAEQRFAGTPLYSFFRVATVKNLILLGRRFLASVYQSDSKVDAGIYFVLLLMRGVHKWVAAMYLHSKWKLSFYHIPKYLSEPGVWRRAASCERPFRTGLLVTGLGRPETVFFLGPRRRVHLKMRRLANVDKLDNSFRGWGSEAPKRPEAKALKFCRSDSPG